MMVVSKWHYSVSYLLNGFVYIRFKAPLDQVNSEGRPPVVLDSVVRGTGYDARRSWRMRMRRYG